ncbi:MAG: glycosyltransferase family 2 protein [Methylococcaceae bacterium]|nr:glycosyltransferase family 2 protein [Methylococcaceae bacterium]
MDSVNNSNKKTPLIFTLVLPAKNETIGLQKMLPMLVRDYPDAEIIVVNDGSSDDTAQLCKKYPVRLISHPYSMGNGSAIKTGARHASHEKIVFMDADGQHDPGDIPRLLARMDEGYEMVVGARQPSSHASMYRRLANATFNSLASVMTGYQVRDLTSGFRAVRTRHFRKFLYLLPNGFSYPTTSTMAFFRSGLPVGYVPIRATRREGKSHIRIFRDGFRFVIIILKIGALFSPMRVFLPIAGALFFTGLSYYVYTFHTFGRFTNMSALLFTSSLLTFLIGLLSEQVSSLHYRGVQEDMRRTKRDDD